MIRDFIVNISKLTKPIEKEDFGTILIVDTQATKAYTEYRTFTELAVDFDDTNDVNKMAKTIFEQDIKPYKVAVLGVKGVAETTPTEVTDELDLNLEQDWFVLTCVDNTDPFITALATYIDTKEKMYFVTSQSKTAPTLYSSDNVVVAYHETAGQYVAEGLASYLMTSDFGKVTAKFKKINNVTVSDITDADLVQLHTDNGLSYVSKYGLPQTSEGKTTSGEWIDVQLGYYWIKLKMEEELAILAYNTPKLDYGSKGISLIKGVVDSVLSQASDQGIIRRDGSDNPIYSITTISREETSTTDITNREYKGVSWTAGLSGAIHSGDISGTLTI